jgi:hypothetical protein
MDNEVIAIFSALLGSFATLTVTYLNNKSKNFELEYNYRKKQEERYLAKAQEHINDIYVPLYSKLTLFHNRWDQIKESKNLQSLKKEMYELNSFKNSLEKEGLTAYLTREVEVDFDQLLSFISNSIDQTRNRYGIIVKYKLLGQDFRTYSPTPAYIDSKSIFIYKVFFDLHDFFTKRYWFFNFGGLIEYNIKIVLDSAPPNSDDFNKQLSDFILSLKNEIKNIKLGTK